MTDPASASTGRAGTSLPSWLLGLANLPVGLANGLTLSAVPQLLAARHVPEPVIADITVAAIIPGFIAFLAGPILDIRFTRRTYAVAATILTAIASVATILAIAHPVLLGMAVFAAGLGSSLNMIAIGGWFGSLVGPQDEARLGTWMGLSGTVGAGLAGMAVVPLLRALPFMEVAILLGLCNLAPLLIYAATSAPPPDPRLARETIGEFVRHIGLLIRQPRIVQLLLLFILPTGAFALTNTLSGLGGDYHASERFVALAGGAVVMVMGVIGALMVPPLVRRFAACPLYLGAGTVGAVVTVLLILLPRTPSSFLLAAIAENLAQTVTLTTVVVAALQSLGRDNPLAATQFGLLTSVSPLPVTYMQWLDGHAYGQGGLDVMFAVDGGVSLVACAAMAVWFRGRRPALEAGAPVRL